jgi:hypothetical protein
MSEWKKRAARAAESILENESLTADLDDTAAKVLLDWGIACAELVAKETAGLDDQEAEQVIDSKLRAVRHLMRRVSKWAANQQDMEAQAGSELLDEIIERAAAIYPHFTPPDGKRRDMFLKDHIRKGRSWLSRFWERRFGKPRLQDPTQIVVDLRRIIEE